MGAAHNQPIPISWGRCKPLSEEPGMCRARAAIRPRPPASLPGSPNSTSTQGSEPSCLTSAITEQLRLVARTFSLLTACRKVLRWEGNVSESGKRGA